MCVSQDSRYVDIHDSYSANSQLLDIRNSVRLRNFELSIVFQKSVTT